jgi:hypothetical protein
MKILHTRTLKSGKRHVLIELQNDDEKLMSIKEGEHYKLGGQVDDIVKGHVITEAHGVYWCSITQQWEAA